ncbi:AlpA family phage regulatory protein [Buttiauxella selenatireducens]|uniref:AlpA family phage regulatory protein n=1 Tax=Buttiauxella selenatireducens TaxID=3073902 RepID=A0ABY9S6G9_9ENTR|nr:AlpA family phage regulatory protein [Buttiauxella sp. R73]WMY72731.1 AlpA family phage regulatory protein [Buttiauxella sp. R73]
MSFEQTVIVGKKPQAANDTSVQELGRIADEMALAERLVDMKMAMEITTLSRRTLLDMEERGEFPERVQVTPGRTAWLLSEIVSWINNIPRRSHYDVCDAPANPSESLIQKVARARRQIDAGKFRFLG